MRASYGGCEPRYTNYATTDIRVWGPGGGGGGGGGGMVPLGSTVTTPVQCLYVQVPL